MGQHLPGMDRQQMEQINFPSVVADIPGYGGGGGRSAYLKVDNGIALLTGRGIVSPHQGLHPEQTLTGDKGLFHEIVRAHLIGPLLAFIVALRGQHKDGHIPHIPHEAEQPQPVLIGESR